VKELTQFMLGYKIDVFKNRLQHFKKYNIYYVFQNSIVLNANRLEPKSWDLIFALACLHLYKKNIDKRIPNSIG